MRFKSRHLLISYYDATKLLIRNGHRKIACIQGPPSSTPNKKRIEGYMDALKDAGMEDSAIIVGNDFSVQNGYLETKLLHDSIANNRIVRSQIELSPELILRDSVAPLI